MSLDCSGMVAICQGGRVVRGQDDWDDSCCWDGGNIKQGNVSRSSMWGWMGVLDVATIYIYIYI